MANLFAFVRFFYWGRRPQRFRNRTRLVKYQQKKLRQIHRHVIRNIDFYANKDGKDFPIIEKKSFMGHFKRFNQPGIAEEDAFALAKSAEWSREWDKTLHGITVGLSSGTSGNRGMFLVSRREQLQWSGYILGRMMRRSSWSLLRRPLRIGLFLRANSNLYKALQNRFVEFHYFDLLQSFDDLVEHLAIVTPEVLVAPANVLARLAALKLGGRLAYQPESIISVAEVLEPDDRRAIASAFGIDVIELYQATEGLLGSACPLGKLILNEDIIYFEKEYVGPHKFIPIITDLYRKTQPLIRYRLGDLLVEDPVPCSCGVPFTHLLSIEGRCDDVLQLTQRGKIIEVFPDVVRRGMILSGVGFQDYRIRQTGANRLEVACDKTAMDKSQKQMLSSLRATLAKVGVEDVEIDFCLLKDEPLVTKRRRVIGPRNGIAFDV